MAAKTVCVIGAGVAGLTAVKECLENGFEPTCYEKDNDVGGVWNFKETATDGDPSIYKSCILNTSKTMTCFSDFPFPKEYTNFPNHFLFKKYLDMYADHFGLKSRIKFQSKILKVSKAEDFDTTGHWNVTVQNLFSESIITLVYDFVIVGSGHFYQPFIPDFQGLDEFQGDKVHSHDYKDFHKFEGKRVLVVGLGNSAGDIACELSRHAEHVFVSTRHGVYVMPRGLDGGLPFDRISITRLNNSLPTFLKLLVIYRKLNYRVSHSGYGLAPNHPFTMRDLIVNDELPTRILVGAITMKTDIKKFERNKISFQDGSEESIDAVVFATGYDFIFPYLEKSLIVIEKRFPYLYKQILPLDLELQTLAVVGVVGTNGPVVPMLEMQSRWAVSLFVGHISLPSQEEMKMSCRRRKQHLEALFGREIRYNIWVPYADYMDDLAFDIGCKPNTLYYFVKNPRLWWKLVVGPMVPHQYRLDGPGKWQWARTIIEQDDEHVWMPMRTRRAGERETEGLYNDLIKFCFTVLFVAVIIILPLAVAKI